MNLTDLGAELQARAKEVPATAAATRLVGVRTRARARRRRQISAVVAVAGVGVVVVGLSPVVSGLRADRTRVPASSGSHRAVRGPLVFDELSAGDPLIVSTVGTRGQSEVVVTFTPRDTNLNVSAFCQVTDLTTEGTAAELVGQVTINGHPTLGTGCGSGAVANSSSADFGDTPQARRAALARDGVLPGQESVLRIRLQTQRGAARTDPTVRLGVAIYELSGPRVVQDGLTIPRLAESDGHNYRLVSFETAPITSYTRRLTLDVSSSRTAGWVSVGNPGGGVSDREERGTVLVDGVEQSSNPSGGTAGFPVNKGTRTIDLRVGAHSTGTMLIAYYERLD